MIASLPIVGWNEYVFEGALTFCSIKWHSNDPNALSYNVLIFIIVMFYFDSYKY
jgi:hypothetical protein